MCGVARKIIAVVGTERMLSNSGGNDQRPYIVCTVYVRDVRIPYLPYMAVGRFHHYSKASFQCQQLL